MRKSLDRVSVGFIGAGRISDLHALEYQANPNAEIVAIADVSREQAAARGKAWGFPDARIYSDYRSLLDDPRVNAVEIFCRITCMPRRRSPPSTPASTSRFRR